ncbi:hypothetical protein [Psychrobacillus sp. L3]|uniref:hypothetical protein n=1 Tax=Psychrobacillus sp. L3 TaxID=3236891 RepID=UPI0036F28012
MAEEIKDTEEIVEEVETEEVDSSAEDVNTDPTEEVEVIEETELEEGKAVPYKRFKEINDKYKEVKDELDKLKNSDHEVESETENPEVNDEIVKPLQLKVSQYEALFQQMYQSKLEQVPEAFKDLIPNVDDVAKLAWIESAIVNGLFTMNKPQDFGGLGANPVPPTITKEQFMKMTHQEKVKLKHEDENLYNQLLK